MCCGSIYALDQKITKVQIQVVSFMSADDASLLQRMKAVVGTFLQAPATLVVGMGCSVLRLGVKPLLAMSSPQPDRSQAWADFSGALFQVALVTTLAALSIIMPTSYSAMLWGGYGLFFLAEQIIRRAVIYPNIKEIPGDEDFEGMVKRLLIDYGDPF